MAVPLRVESALLNCAMASSTLVRLLRSRFAFYEPHNKCDGLPMTFFILKALLSGALIAIISEVARRYPSFGGLIASLPLVSLIAIIWLWNDSGGDRTVVAGHARATLWFVVPSLPFFLVLPFLLERNMNFWLALLIASSITVILYLFAIWFAGRMGIDFK
jgi:hypothetical protein